MKRLVFISDTHMKEIELPKGDILIHCGDLTFRGSVDEITKALTWLGKQDFEHILLTPGNHDWLFQLNEPLARKICEANNIRCLIDESVSIDGINFYGSPWQPWFYDWAFNLQRGNEIKAKWDLIPKDTDVLFTHGPAKGMLDYVIRGENVGCEELMAKIMEIKPKIYASGHIHYSYGEKFFNGTHFINASICDESYLATNSPIVVDYD